MVVAFLQSFEIQAWNTTDGWDASNVPCKIVSVNAMLGFSFRNPSKLFGMHVHPGPIDLHVLQRSIAYGKVLLCQKHSLLKLEKQFWNHTFLLYIFSLYICCCHSSIAKWFDQFSGAFITHLSQDLQNYPNKFFTIDNVFSESTDNYKTTLCATIQVVEFYQPPNSGSMVSMVLQAKEVPLYGVGPLFDIPRTKIHFSIQGLVVAKIHWLWQLYPHRHTSILNCSFLGEIRSSHHVILSVSSCGLLGAWEKNPAAGSWCVAWMKKKELPMSVSVSCGLGAWEITQEQGSQNEYEWRRILQQRLKLLYHHQGLKNFSTKDWSFCITTKDRNSIMGKGARTLTSLFGQDCKLLCRPCSTGTTPSKLLLHHFCCKLVIVCQREFWNWTQKNFWENVT